MRHLLSNRYLLAMLVVLGLAAVFGLASVTSPGALTVGGRQASAAARAGVVSAVRACPAPGSAGPTAASLVLAASSSGTGKAQVSALSPAGSATVPRPLQVLTQPGRLSLVNVPVAPAAARGVIRAPAGSKIPTVAAQGGVQIQAAGSMARGLEVEQALPGGLSTAQCQSPGTDFWFAGPGQRSASVIQLYLMNTDDQPADATVQMFTDTGPVIGSTDAGITVPPHGQVVQTLAPALNGSHVMALNVMTSVGRVVAAALETAAGKPGAWLPPASEPVTTTVLPGLPGTPGGGTLYVVVPGTANAQLTVTAVTARGSYHPTGGTAIDLPGGSASAVPLPSLAGIAAALTVTSNVPVSMSLGIPGGPAGAPGVFTVGTGPVIQQGVIAGNPAGSGGASVIVLSAPGKAARVRVSELTAAGQAAAAPQAVALKAGHTAAVPVKAPAPFTAVITPLRGSGPVYAGRVVTQGGAPQSLVPVTSALIWVPLPPVRSSLGSALP